MSERELLQNLRIALAAVQLEHDLMQPPEGDPGCVDRSAALAALDEVLEFLRLARIQSSALQQLMAALCDLAEQGRHAAMLAAPRLGHRPPDATGIQGVKGVIAGIVRLQMDAGKLKPEAAKWVVKNMPSTLRHKLSPNKPLSDSAPADWYDQYGGDYGNSGMAREQYRATLEAGGNGVADAKLIAWMRVADRLLAAPKSKQALT